MTAEPSDTASAPAASDPTASDPIGSGTTGSERPATMRLSMITGPGVTELVEVAVPTPGPRDVLLKVRACGICGSDAMYIARGGLPGREGATPLGHEPAGEVVEVGAEVVGIAVGDHVVVNPMAAPSGIIGSGGASGGLADYLLIEEAVLGTSLAIVPEELPFEVAALNEPMAVAYHAVNRTQAGPGDSVVVFGAGPVGLGAAIGFLSKGVAHVTVVDVLAGRLEKALRVGVHAVIDSSKEDVLERLIELQGEGPARRGVRRAGTDVFLDATGAAPVLETVFAIAKHGATLGIVGVHKKPVPVDFGDLLGSELTVVLSMGYPTEIFEVTADIVANASRYAEIISDRFAFDDTVEALRTAGTPGAADKVMVTFD